MKVPRCASVRCVGMKVCPVYKSVPRRAHRCQGAEVCECRSVGAQVYRCVAVWVKVHMAAGVYG